MSMVREDSANTAATATNTSTSEGGTAGQQCSFSQYDEDEETRLKKLEAQHRRKLRNKELQLKKRKVLGELSVNKKQTNGRSVDKELTQKDVEKSMEHYKRYATRFTKNQIEMLNEWYLKNRNNPYASEGTVENLSKATGIEIKSVRKWLSNKRTRLFETRTFRKKS